MENILREKMNAKIDASMKEINKLSNPNLFAKIFGNNNERFTKICELYQDVINSYITKKEYDNALTFTLIRLDILKNNKEILDIPLGMEYLEIAKIQEKINQLDSIKYYKLAYDNFGETHNRNNMIKTLMKIGDIYKQNDEIDNSIIYYKQAIELCDAFDDDATQNKISLIIAGLCVQKELFSDAMIYYEATAKKYLDNHIMKFSSSKYFFLSMLSCICNDNMNESKSKYDEYVNNNYVKEVEKSFINNILKSIEDDNIEDFQQIIREYDDMHALDEVQIALLKYIKNNIFNSVL